ncbi:hypothetical protein [Hydrogenophaga sp.]|uniref:hypothetical protein n=1 Tax=Hydrogenophaga sp. TaxID=1904254 RepID=UPI002FC86D29
MTNTPKMTFHVESRRVDAHGSLSRCKSAEIALDTDETDQRLALLHDNVRKYGTVFNTVSPGTDLRGSLRRR